MAGQGRPNSKGEDGVSGALSPEPRKAYQKAQGLKVPGGTADASTLLRLFPNGVDKLTVPAALVPQSHKALEHASGRWQRSLPLSTFGGT